MLRFGFSHGVAVAFRSDAQKAQILQIVKVFLYLFRNRTGVVVIELALPVAVEVQILRLLAPSLCVLLHPSVSGRSLNGQMVIAVERCVDDVDVLRDIHRRRNLCEDVCQGVNLHVGILLANDLGHPVQEVIEHGGFVVFVLGVHGDAVVCRKGLSGQLYAVFKNNKVVAVAQAQTNGRLLAYLEEFADFVRNGFCGPAVVEVQLSESIGAFFRRAVGIAQVIFRMLIEILAVGQPVAHNVARQHRLNAQRVHTIVGSACHGIQIGRNGGAVHFVSCGELVERLKVHFSIRNHAAHDNIRNLPIIDGGNGNGILGIVQSSTILVGTGPDDACVFRQEVVDAVLHAALIGAEDVDPVVHSTNRKAVQLANGFQIFRKQFLDLGNSVRSRQNDFQTLAGMLRNDGELCAADLLGDVLHLLGGKLQKRFPGSGQVDFGVGFAIDGQMGQVHYSRDQTGNGRFQIRLRAVHSSLIHSLVFQNRQSRSQGALESAPAFIGVADVFFVLVRIVKSLESALIGRHILCADGDLRQRNRLSRIRHFHHHGDNGTVICLSGDNAAVADRYRSIAALVADSSSGKRRNGVGFAGVQFHSGGNVHGGLAAALRAVQDGAGPVLRDGHKIDVFKLPGILLPFPGGQGNGEILPVDQHRILHDDPRDLGKDLRGVVCPAVLHPRVHPDVPDGNAAEIGVEVRHAAVPDFPGEIPDGVVGPLGLQVPDVHAVNGHAAFHGPDEQRRVGVSLQAAVLHGDVPQRGVFKELAHKEALAPAAVGVSLPVQGRGKAVPDGDVLQQAAHRPGEQGGPAHLPAHVDHGGAGNGNVLHHGIRRADAVNHRAAVAGDHVDVVKAEVLYRRLAGPGNKGQVPSLGHRAGDLVPGEGMHLQPGDGIPVTVQPDIRRNGGASVVADGHPAVAIPIKVAAFFKVGLVKYDVIGQFEVAVDVSVLTQMGPDVIQIRFGGDHVGRFFRTGGTARPVLAGRNFPCKDGKITDCGDGHACCQQQRQASLESSLFHYVCLLLVSVFVRSQNRMRAPLLCLKLICLIARFSTYRACLFVHSVSIFACNTFFVNEPFFPNTPEFFSRKNCAGEKNRAKPGFAQHFP